MLFTSLLPRPWSCHVPRVNGFEPTIQARITRVDVPHKNKWRFEVLVDGTPMCHGHQPTKRQAESKAATMMEAYTESHYVSK